MTAVAPRSTTDASAAGTPHRLLLPARTAALAILALALVGFVAMAAWLRGRSSETSVDREVRVWLFAHTGRTVQHALLALSEPALTVGVIGLVGLAALLARRWDVVALCAVGPLLGLILESVVLKPLIDRHYLVYFGAIRYPAPGVETGLAFPSGHETGLTSMTALLAVLLLRAPIARGLRVAAWVALGVWTVLGAVGLVRSLYHYATDTVGGVLLGVMVIGATALAIDLLAGRLSSPAGRVRTRTSLAA